MSGIAIVAPAERRQPIEARQPPERDGKQEAPPRHPRKRRSDADLVEVEQHELDVEA